MGSSPKRVGKNSCRRASKPLVFKGFLASSQCGNLGGFGEAWLRCPRRQERAPDGFHHQGPDAPSPHRRPGYPLSSCVPAEPGSVSPGSVRLASTEQCGKPPSDTGAMPQELLYVDLQLKNGPKLPTRLGEEPEFVVQTTKLATGARQVEPSTDCSGSRGASALSLLPVYDMTSGFIRTAADMNLEVETETQRESTEPDEKPAASPLRPQGTTQDQQCLSCPHCRSRPGHPLSMASSEFWSFGWLWWNEGTPRRTPACAF